MFWPTLPFCPFGGSWKWRCSIKMSMTVLMILVFHNFWNDRRRIQRLEMTDLATRMQQTAAEVGKDNSSLDVMMFPPPYKKDLVGVSTSTTPYRSPTSPSFLLYFAHSGYSNQVIALQHAAQLAYKLNRTLVVPPVLPHTNEEIKLFPDWKRDAAGTWCQAYQKYAIHQIKAVKQARIASHSDNFPSFANIIDFSVLTETTGLKTLDLDEFMQHQNKGRLGYATAIGFSKTFFSSYNISVHTWCNANINLNITYQDGVPGCQFDRDLKVDYPTLLTYIQRQLDLQHQQVEYWEGGYYYRDCHVLNVGSAFLTRNNFLFDPAAPLFDSFFSNYPLVEPWMSILKGLLDVTGGNFVGVHVRVKDGHKYCADSSSLYQQAARDVWALYNNDKKISISKNSTNNNQYDDDGNNNDTNVLVIVGRVNGNSKFCLQQALKNETAAAGATTTVSNISSSSNVLQVLTVNDLIDSHENKTQLQQWISSIELEVSTIYLLLDQFLLSLSKHLVMQSVYEVSTFQREISERRAHRTQNLINLGFLGT
jgi:hypothetical protein